MTDGPTTIEQLETRLQRGWELIDEAERQSDERAASRYTQRWLNLLTDYEELAREQTRRESPPAEN